MAEVTVMGDENSSFPVGDSENFMIGQTRWVINDDPANFMPLIPQIAAKSHICALV
jgi:hypothetical protein